MKKISELLKDYLKATIKTKRGMEKRIKELEKELEETKENELFAIERMNKYKKRLRDLRKKENHNE